MKPREAVSGHITYLAEQFDHERIAQVLVGGPEEGDGIIPCPTAIGDGGPDGMVSHVAYELNEIDLAHLARGGTLWLSTWGGLPIHLLHVQEPG